MSPETELLLWCARAQPDAASTIRIKELLKQEIIWPSVLEAATRHGLMPLLHHHLSTFDASAVGASAVGASAVGAQAVPKLVRDSLHTAFKANAARSFFLTTELLQVLEAFEAHGVRAINYKGPALSHFLYDSLLLREFCDLDLLLRRQDLAKAEELLISLGYEKQFHSDIESNEYAHRFARVAQGAVIELHWDIAPRHYALHLDFERLWQRLATAELSGRKILMPSPEDLMLILCWHGHRHHWARLEWIGCVAEIARRHPNLDWSYVLTQARKSGSRRVLLLALSLAHDLLQAPLPATVVQKMRSDRVLAALARQMHAGLFRETECPPSRSTEALRFFRLKSRERLRDKARYCLRLALTPHQIRWPALWPARQPGWLQHFRQAIRPTKKFVL